MDHMSTKLFVGNLSFNTTENDLHDAFAAHGTVVDANLMMDRASPFCFISFVAAWRQAGCRRDRQIARSQDKQMEEHIEVEGRILTVLAGTMFRVELDNKHQVLATISGKMRKRFVRLIVGD